MGQNQTKIKQKNSLWRGPQEIGRIVCDLKLYGFDLGNPEPHHSLRALHLSVVTAGRIALISEWNTDVWSLISAVGCLEKAASVSKLSVEGFRAGLHVFAANVGEASIGHANEVWCKSRP